MTQQSFFHTGVTLPLKYRREQLLALKCSLQEHEQELYRAFITDMHKCSDEAFYTEIHFVYAEIDTFLKYLRCWSRDKHVRGSLLIEPSVSYIHYEPLGRVLILAPWNYPVNLLLCPLVGAIGAGCCVTLKPSPLVPTINGVLRTIITETFPKEYIDFVEGDISVVNTLLAQSWDMIFFTGSSATGRVIAQAAAERLIPCVLELGGKSPCIIDKDADLSYTTSRVVWGKLLNGGQTCIAPDYLLIHESIKESFLVALQEAVTHLLDDYSLVKDFGSVRHESYLQNHLPQRTYGPLTVIDCGTLPMRGDTPKVLSDEIFGTIFPLLTFSSHEAVIDYITSHEKPLALYYFGKTYKDILSRTSSGGAVVNDTLLHIVNNHLPFGGVGNSGYGKYHGRFSFETFSNPKAVVYAYKLPRWLRFLKEVPFVKVSWLRKFLSSGGSEGM